MPLNPPPVIADLFKVELKWNPYQGVKPTNRLHFHSAAGTVSQLAAALEAHLTAGMFDPMSTGQTLTTFGITPLDGTTAEQEFTWAGIAGAATGEIIPQGAAIVSLRTLQRGPRGRGRVYVGPVVEGEVINGALGDAATLQAAWIAFQAAMFAAAGAWVFEVATYKHLTSNTVTTIIADPLIGTQRRRMDQLRKS